MVKSKKFSNKGPSVKQPYPTTRIIFLQLIIICTKYLVTFAKSLSFLLILAHGAENFDNLYFF